MTASGKTLYQRIDRLLRALYLIGFYLFPCLYSQAMIDTSLPPYEVSVNSKEDQSEKIQAALDLAGKNGGDRVMLPSGTIYAKGLSLPGKVILSGQGIGATVLKLTDKADTWLIASSGFVNNKPWADMYGGVEDMTLDGNRQNNKSGSILIIKGYRFLARNCQFRNSPLHGVLISSESADGTANNNGMAENRITNCSFDGNAGAGIYAKNSNGQIADGMIFDNYFNRNGEQGFYQIDLERSAGFHIVGNQMYSGKLGDLRALQAGALIVRGNNFDGSNNEPLDDGRVRQVIIKGAGWGSCIINGNLFHNHAKEGGEWTMLEIHSNAKDAICVSGNVFRSERIKAKPYETYGREKSSIIFQGNALQKEQE